jgi:hypothetical protein
VKRLFLLLLLLSSICVSAKATVIAGTFKYPNGALVNGYLYISLDRVGRNVCVTPSVMVPTSQVSMRVINGVIQGSVDILATDCLATFQPYTVQLQDQTHAVLFREYWWITEAALQGNPAATPAQAGQITPSSGNKLVQPAGLLPATSGWGAFRVAQPFGGLKTSTSGTATLGISSIQSFTLTWPTLFTDTSYAAVCTSTDTTSAASPLWIVFSIVSKTTSSITVQAKNLSVSGSRTGTVRCKGHA